MLAETDLPDNFAANLLELEMELQSSDAPSKELIFQLNEFYTSAMDHYSRNGQPVKYRHFKNKLIRLFGNSKIMNRLDESNADTNTKINARAGLQDEIQKCKLYQTSVAQSIILQSQRSSRCIQTIKTKSLNDQEQTLQGRLLLRQRERMLMA